MTTASLEETILEMTSKRLGCTAVVNDKDDNKVVGIICDGDLRRMMKQHHEIYKLHAADIMTANPKCVAPDEYAVNALHLMRANSITQLIVVDDANHYLGVVHLHDILREGII